MAKRSDADKDSELKLPPAVIKQLEAVVNAAVKQEVDDFKSTFKGAFIQLSDDVDELKEQIGDGKREEHRLLLTQKLYKTDMREILEVSRIAKGAAEPLAYALALDAKTGRRGLSKGISLTTLVIDNILRLNLSGGGWNRGLSMPALVEQVGVASEEGESGIPTVEAGSRR